MTFDLVQSFYTSYQNQLAQRLLLKDVPLISLFVQKKKLGSVAMQSQSGRITLRILLGLLFAAATLLLFNRPIYADEIFIPMVIGIDGGCITSAESGQIADFMRNSADQQRSELGCNEALAAAAQTRAEDMAQNGYFGHTSPSGMTPNRLVEMMGYNLPDHYQKDGNNIESIAAGTRNAEETWDMLMKSPQHKTHLVGENSFYRSQVDFGVGYAHNPDSKYQHYWVVITAESGD